MNRDIRRELHGINKDERDTDRSATSQAEQSQSPHGRLSGKTGVEDAPKEWARTP